MADGKLPRSPIPSYIADVGEYPWRENTAGQKIEDEIAPDAITVGIRTDTRMLTIAGLQFGQREAVLYWPDWPGRGEPIKAAIEDPMPVEHALERAEKLCSRYAFKRVVIWLQHRELWDGRWVKLASDAGVYQ
jgi:hypothetical protein